MARGPFIFIASALAGSVVALHVNAGGDKVAFPENYALGVMYMTHDRPVSPTPSMAGIENIARYQEYYITSAAIETLRKDKALPSGTVITNVMYRAQLDAEGKPLKDANGRYVKGELFGFNVMEKRAGWGADRLPEVRNGDWEYQFFKADKAPDDKVHLAACFQCHGSQAEKDFVFTLDQLKAAAARLTK